jgi:hypothetical protein
LFISQGRNTQKLTAKVIHAEREMQAAAMLSQQSQAMQLRYLQTMADISSSGKAPTIVFPLPLDLIQPLMSAFA